ncbi:MAG TPA: hypothetical protein VHJ19_02885 [Gammaproteobacteria bacterium]|nr:hypothetical protein [Gammaproteobacteria bacterium]
MGQGLEVFLRRRGLGYHTLAAGTEKRLAAGPRFSAKRYRD